MPISEARARANKKWNDAHQNELYDRISIALPKGTKEKVKAAAAMRRISVNSFLNRIIMDAIEQAQKEQA